METATERRSSHQAALVVVLCVALAALLLPADRSEAGKRKRNRSWTKTTRLAPGVKYTRIKDVKGPYRIHIVSITLAKASTLDTVLANEELPGFERTSSMARRSHALVAINGDYARSSGRPVYTFASDGELDQTPLDWGRNFAVNKRETVTHIQHPEVDAWMTDASAGYTFRFDRVNAGDPDQDELALYTAAGGWEERPPKNACSARLIRETPLRMRAEGGIEAGYVVEQVRCGEGRLWPKGGVVASTPLESTRVSEVTSLVPGQSMDVGWTLGWQKVLDTVGGNPTLIEDGSIVGENVDGSGAFFNRHPRTGVGANDRGKVFFVTVDGRQKGYSIGMTLRRFAKVFKSLGATWALNLDGGGSTTMVVKGKVRNSPSDGSERAVSSALVLLPGADRNERRIRSSPPAETDTERASPFPLPIPGFDPYDDSLWSRVVSDPASTGGLADSLLQRGIPISDELRRAGLDFRLLRSRASRTGR